MVRPEEQPKYVGSFALLYKAKRDPPTFPEKNARAGEDPTTRRASFQTPQERGKTGEHDDEQSQGEKQSVPLLCEEECYAVLLIAHCLSPQRREQGQEATALACDRR